MEPKIDFCSLPARVLACLLLVALALLLAGRAVAQTGPVRLTTGALYPENLVWSPDGTRLAFNSRPNCAEVPECEYAAELYVVTVAGGQLMRLTDNDRYDGDPSWSPDGAQLAYESRSTADGDRHL